MAPVPANQKKEALSLIIELLGREDKPTEIELLRLKNLIEEVEKEDMAAGRSFRGAYLDIIGKSNEAKEWHLSAIEKEKHQQE